MSHIAKRGPIDSRIGSFSFDAGAAMLLRTLGKTSIGWVGRPIKAMWPSRSTLSEIAYGPLFTRPQLSVPAAATVTDHDLILRAAGK